ncbi:MAG: carboxylating nicotinate-nucleotide diphosphorylase [Alphaproteobacteria bacterium]
MKLSDTDIDRVIDLALAEDIGGGDVTTNAVIPDTARLTAEMRTRQALVVAGIEIAARVFRRLSPACKIEILVPDGAQVPAGTVLARIEGPARPLLTAERTALNLAQHLSGIATLTRTYADRIEGTGAVLLDTRKTLPGLRRLEKYATHLGGAENHRMGLYDGVLIKDNHIAVAGGVGAAVAAAKAAGLTDIEVECDSLAQVEQALAAGAKRLLLDNMGLETLTAAVRLARGRTRTEASGGVTLETIRAIAETGVDCVSVGRITQSAPSADIGLDYA